MLPACAVLPGCAPAGTEASSRSGFCSVRRPVTPGTQQLACHPLCARFLAGHRPRDASLQTAFLEGIFQQLPEDRFPASPASMTSQWLLCHLETQWPSQSGWVSDLDAGEGEWTLSETLPWGCYLSPTHGTAPYLCSPSVLYSSLDFSLANP